MRINKVVNARLFESGHALDQSLVEICIEEGYIKSIEAVRPDSSHMLGDDVLDAQGSYVSPGFIDVHVHCYHGNTAIGIDADEIGAYTGVTTLIDAGTSGANTVSDFRKTQIDKAQTRIAVLLNVASEGLKTLSELSEEDAINLNKIKDVLEDSSVTYAGLKARASSSVLGNRELAPIVEAKAISKITEMPLVVHVGNAPPRVEDVLDLMDKGDVITHCFNSKPNGILNEVGIIKREFLQARDRGVLFDVGHGSSSFSFEVAKKAIELGFVPDLIGSDLYDKNRTGPVVSLVRTMNKLILSGMSVEQVIDAVTHKAAQVHGLQDRGRITTGLLADMTIFNIEASEMELKDSDGNIGHLDQCIVPKFSVIGGQLFEVDPGGI